RLWQFVANSFQNRSVTLKADKRDSPPRLQSALDFLDLERLEDISLFDVVETFEADPAFQPLADFPRVGLPALQRGNAVFVQNPLIAHDADSTGAPDPSVQHPATGDAAETADVKRLQHHRPPRRSLDFLRRQEPFQRFLDVVGDLVNDSVRTDFDPF